MSSRNNQTAAPTAFDLLSRFIHLRQSGTNRDDAWYQVCDAEGEINEVTLKAFLSLAKNWERREGHQYHYRSEKQNDETLPRSEVPVVKKETQPTAQVQPKAQTQPKPPVPPGKNNGLTGTLDAAKLRESEQRRLEQILDQLDDLPEEDQPSRGKEPPAQVSRENPQPKTQTAKIGVGRDFFGPRTLLLMYFRNHPQPLRVSIAGSDELFIGRATENSAMNPEIDLNLVNGSEYGVSRMHAAITRRNNQLLICDLDSLNFTYVNGVRLFPKEVRVLQDGDEVWFGQLYCRIRFQQA
jgi:hypothetical protein